MPVVALNRIKGNTIRTMFDNSTSVKSTDD